ncbi:MAG: InlB B-repeat-containing protein [Clostridiales bacterium]|nr:InlB B-repeat-containing protein [Clostridiales bacterium]
MQRAHRFRFFIIATIACAILLCIAAFSVSWAKWTGSTAPKSVTPNGTSGLNYVAAPKDITTEDECVLVRELEMQNTSSADDTYEYRNYVCVKRTGGTGTDDNSIAFLEFTIEGMGNTNDEVLSTIPVESITISRRKTDSNGNPLTGSAESTPHLYNYDASSGKTVYLSNIGHGNWHDKPFDTSDPDMQGKSTENMIRHYDDGMYCVVFFGDDTEQYFALDIVIVTTKAAEFKLGVHVSNINHWQRYKQGYGEEWGFYMGGLINGVWTWDPRRTTKMSGSPIIKGVKTGTNADVLSSTEYEESKPITTYYPKASIDYSLTVNLTAGTIIKPYFLDDSGYRRQKDGEKDSATAYLLPKTIIAPDSLYDGGKPRYNIDGDVATVADINLYIPVSGEYTFRLKGNVEPKYNATKGNWYIHLQSGKTMQALDSNKPSQTDGWYGVPNFNFMVDEMWITTPETANKTYSVTFNLNGGSWTGSNITGKALGDTITKPTAIPTKADGSKFVGWYTDLTDGEEFDFANTKITGDITLYARWESLPTLSYSGKVETLLLHTSNTDSTVIEYSLTDITLNAGVQLTFNYNGRAITLVNLWDDTNHYKAVNDDGCLVQSGSALTTQVAGKYTFYLKNSVRYSDQWCLYVACVKADDDKPIVKLAADTGAYYLVGTFLHQGTDFIGDYGIKLTYNNNQYELLNVHLTAGDQFKIRNSSTWYSTIASAGGDGGGDYVRNVSNNSGNNLLVLRSGTFSFYLKPNSGSNDQLYFGFTPDTTHTGETTKTSTSTGTGSYLLTGKIRGTEDWQAQKGYIMYTSSYTSGGTTYTTYVVTGMFSAGDIFALKSNANNWNTIYRWSSVQASQNCENAWDGDQNIKINVAGTYRIYFRTTDYKIYIVKV